MLCIFDFLLFYNFGEKAREDHRHVRANGLDKKNKLQFSFGWAECLMPFSP